MMMNARQSDKTKLRMVPQPRILFVDIKISEAIVP